MTKMQAVVRRARIMRPSLSCRRSSRLLASSHAQPCSTTQRSVPSPEPCGSPILRMQGWISSRKQSWRGYGQCWGMASGGVVLGLVNGLAVAEADALDQLAEALGAIETAPSALGRLGELEDHGQCGLA